MPDLLFSAGPGGPTIRPSSHKPKETDMARMKAALAAVLVMEKEGVMLLIDPMSYQYLVGAEIDYTEGLEGSQFVIRNPNATSTCGCGSSFSV